MCGKTPSSMPVRNTTGNSRPLAVCRVMSVMTPVDSVVVVGDLVGVGDQRDPLQELGERTGFLLAPLLFELQGHSREFLEVLDAGLVLGVGGRLQLGEVAGAFQYRFQDDGGSGAGLHDRCAARP